MVRASTRAATAAVLACLLLVAGTVAAGWSDPRRVTPQTGSRLDSLHQLAAGRDALHLAYARLGTDERVDRVVYQRSRSGGRWSDERILFRASAADRSVVPNLAVAARGDLVAVAWRVVGPTGTVLFLRVSRDGGDTFEAREVVASSGRANGLGVPAVAIGDGFLAVAWTDRRDGDIRLRRSTDEGRTFRRAGTLGHTALTIICGGRRLDGLVGLAASGRRLHLAWSVAPAGECLASRIRSRSSGDRGRTWGDARLVTDARSFGWPQLSASGRRVLATVQLTSGSVLVARSRDGGATWREARIVHPDGRRLSAADVLLRRRGIGWLAYVEEDDDGGRLASTRVRVRRTNDGGRTWGPPTTVADMADRLRQAANVSAIEGTVVVVYQSGGLDGSPRDLFVTRRE